MATRSSKRRKVLSEKAAEIAKAEANMAEARYSNPPTAPATDDDRRIWQGWCDIESDPAYFNSIIKKWGITGARIQEVLCLDEETLYGLPQPIYGIIFLFKYSELEDEEEAEQAISNQVWFARQRMRNACGSIALLNLVMNIPNVELGKHINRFRNSTKDMSPNQRGKAVAEFAFVRQAHNSWARKSDMMNEDKLLRENVLKKNQYKKRGTTARPSRKKKKDEYENAYHYIAYMPANGEIWRMDGMEKSAESFGSYSEETWLAQVVSVLQERMELLVNQGIQFNVLAMTKDPLLNIRTDLAQNIKSISALESRLEEVQPSLRGPVTNGHEINAQDQRSLTPDSLSKSEKGVEKYSEADTINGDTAMTKEGSPESPYPLRGPVPLYGIDSSMIENLGALLRACHILENDPNPAPATLLRLYRDLAADQAKLRDAYMDEESKQRSEEKKAEARRWDYVPLVRQWVKYLAEAEDLDTGKPVLDELIKQDKEDEEKMDVDDSRSASNFSKSASPKGLMRRGG